MTRTPPRDDRAVTDVNGVAGIADKLTAARGRGRLSRFLRWALVLPLLVLWIVGWILPAVPGFPFLILALVLIAPDFAPARRLVVKGLRRFPRLRRAVPKSWRRTRLRP